MTVSLSGQRVAFTRRRRSTRSASGMLMWKGQMALLSTAAARCAGSRLRAPAAADVASRLRRVGDNDIADMSFLPDGNEPRAGSSVGEMIGIHTHVPPSTN